MYHKGQLRGEHLQILHRSSNSWRLGTKWWFPRERCVLHWYPPSVKIYFGGAARQDGARKGVVSVSLKKHILLYSFFPTQLWSNNMTEDQALKLGLQMTRGFHQSRTGPDRLDWGPKICQTVDRGPDRSGVGPDQTGPVITRTEPDPTESKPVLSLFLSISLCGLNSTPNPQALSQYNAPPPPLHLIDYQDHQLNKNFIHTKVPHMNQEARQWGLQD